MACEDYPCCGHEMGDCEGKLYGSDEAIKARAIARIRSEKYDAYYDEDQEKKVGEDYLSILMKWHPDGNFTEQDLWDAIAEAEGVDVSEISDRDLTEFIQEKPPVISGGFFLVYIQRGKINNINICE